MISGYVATQFSSKIFDSAGVYAPRRFHCQLQTNGISCKNLSTIQRSDQELQTSWAGTLVLSMVWVDKTMMVSSSNFSATPRKTASGNSCKILSTIQWSDQELWTIWAGTLVWPDETAQASHGDFIAMPRKRASWNPCKTLSTIQRSDQELWTIWAGTLVWPDKTPQASLGNLIATPRKQASWNSCKNLSTMQRSDQELRTCWAGTLVWPEETPPASNGDFIVTPRKQASWDSCKYLRTIQRSDQELRTSWAETLVWSLVLPDKTLVVSSCNISATLRKIAPVNFSKNLSTIQRSDQELWTSWAGTLVWPD